MLAYPHDLPRQRADYTFAGEENQNNNDEPDDNVVLDILVSTEIDGLQSQPPMDFTFAGEEIQNNNDEPDDNVVVDTMASSEIDGSQSQPPMIPAAIEAGSL